MENRLSVFKGADISENFLEDGHGTVSILADTDGVVRIRSHGHNLAAQLLETAQIVLGGQK